MGMESMLYDHCSAPTSFNLSLRVPLNAISKIPGLPSPTPPSNPPTYCPPIKIHGTDERPTIFPSSARIGFPSDHGSSSLTVL
mmetsp:Transcript_20389/g.43711  ORF Transcript_20389/g.43711 Transcript_20389/m.43711 type:complete len:83 (+) Transcript_20389:200-448(+)